MTVLPMGGNLAGSKDTAEAAWGRREGGREGGKEGGRGGEREGDEG
jgi:hypothetical protein